MAAEVKFDQRKRMRRVPGRDGAARPPVRHRHPQHRCAAADLVGDAAEHNQCCYQPMGCTKKIGRRHRMGETPLLSIEAICESWHGARPKCVRDHAVTDSRPFRPRRCANVSYWCRPLGRRVSPRVLPIGILVALKHFAHVSRIVIHRDELGGCHHVL